MRARQLARPGRIPIVWAAILLWTVTAGAAPDTVFGQDRRIEPSVEEMLLVYELNRARSNPSGYAREQGLGGILDAALPLPPLAINEALTASARFHADEMAAHDYFDHQSAVTGAWPNELARRSGYPLPASLLDERNNIESLAAGFPTPAEAVRALIEDAGVNPPGHRYHLLAMGPDRAFWQTHREVGAGHAYGANTTYGDFYVLHTAPPPAPWPYLTGVVYEDRNENGRYDAHEGLGGVEIAAYGDDDRMVNRTTTSAVGGFSLPLAPGTYRIVVSGEEFVGTALGVTEVVVTVRNDNVHLAVQSAPSNAKLSVEVNFEHQTFEPVDRSAVRENGGIAASTSPGGDAQQERAGSSSSSSGLMSSSGCSAGGGQPAGAPVQFLLALLLLGALVHIRGRSRRTGDVR